MKMKRKFVLGVAALLPFHLAAQNAPLVDVVCDDMAQPFERKDPCVERAASSPIAVAGEELNKNTDSESSKKFDIRIYRFFFSSLN